MGNLMIGKPIAEDTNEIKLKWLQHQIAERKQAIKQLEIDKENLTLVRAPQLEEMILRKLNEIKKLTGDQEQKKAIDVTPTEGG